MASTRAVVVLLALLMINVVSARKMTTGTKSGSQQEEDQDEDQQMVFKYHKGPLLTGKIGINLIWYGKFKPSERAIVSDFITSLSQESPQQQPSVALWLKQINKHYTYINSKNSIQPILSSTQILNEQYSLGKSLKLKQIEELASTTKGISSSGSINVVLTSSDVVVEGFCSSKCGTHGSVLSKQNNTNNKFAYIWNGNSETQCPGQCAWPFHQPIYGPQNPPLVAPNNNVGMDGMVMNLATLLAGTFTNPFGNGYYQGPSTAPLEAASACPGIFGKGAYPGFAGNLLVDSATGASYNAHGINGRKYLLPALFDPTTNSCSTLV